MEWPRYGRVGHFLCLLGIVKCLLECLDYPQVVKVYVVAPRYIDLVVLVWRWLRGFGLRLIACEARS